MAERLEMNQKEKTTCPNCGSMDVELCGKAQRDKFNRNVGASDIEAGLTPPSNVPWRELLLSFIGPSLALLMVQVCLIPMYLIFNLSMLDFDDFVLKFSLALACGIVLSIIIASALGFSWGWIQFGGSSLFIFSFFSRFGVARKQWESSYICYQCGISSLDGVVQTVKKPRVNLAVLASVILGGILLCTAYLIPLILRDFAAVASFSVTPDVRYTDPEEVARLIEEGANVNAFDRDGRTPLMLAVLNNSNADVLRLLIENGANVNVVDRDGRTLLMLAAMRNSNLDVFQVLIEEGADVNAVDKEGQTPFTLAARTNNNPDVLEFLIENGADISNVDTLFMRAASGRRNPDILRVFIENGADVNAANNDGETPLMRAARNDNNPDVLRFLIENGADVNAVDNDGWTPLMIAAYFNSSSSNSGVLIENGADVNAVNAVHKDGRTPLLYAARQRRPSLEIFQVLLENGADVNTADKNGETLLMRGAWAAWTDLDFIRLFLENGADVNAANNDGETPLMLAVGPTSPTSWLLPLLIENGADVNAVNNDGETTLMLVAGAYSYVGDVNSLNRIKLLIENGADVAIKNNEGKTALDYAQARRRSSDVLDLLREKTPDETE